MRILAIETSCDETAIAIIETVGKTKTPSIRVLANKISSQVKIHAPYGGVVPNLAKREHQKNIIPILLQALNDAGMLKKDLRITNYELRKKKKIEKILEREQELLQIFKKEIIHISKPSIDAIAVTIGPGLEPALWVGINFAKALAYVWNMPIIPVNHMEGHIFSALLKKSGKDNFQIFPPSIQKKIKIRDGEANFQFPMLALLVSGGHTEIVLVRNFGKYKILGETLDDAAGEAFDKVARLLGLPYPGGPQLAAFTEMKTRNPKHETRNKFQILNLKSKIKLPRSMINSNNFNFSFSGLKTAVLYLIRDLETKYGIEIMRPLIAKEFQNAVVDVLTSKTIRAAKQYKTKSILLGGGVAANNLLRAELAQKIKKELPNTSFNVSLLSLTGDNALMIAVAAFFKNKKAMKHVSSLKAEGQLRLM